MNKICLAMVVKNEASLIRRALQSAKPYIDQWVIVDTGSTDGTQDIIRAEMKGIEGELYHRPWVNYGHNRSEALELAYKLEPDFILILDGDEKLTLAPGYRWPAELDRDTSYWATVKYGTITYTRPNILSTKYRWFYVGVTHEYATSEPRMPKEELLPIFIETEQARTHKTIDRCLDDIRMLEADLEKDPNNYRSVFYLAESYRSCNQFDKAVEYYEKRAVMGGWREEVWYSYFQIAQIKEAQKKPENEIIMAYLQAHEYNPARSESLGALAFYLRSVKHYHNLAYLFSKVAKDTPRPNERLFVQDIYYDWRNQDEYSLAAYWSGHYWESIAACDDLLKSGKLPDYEIERIKINRQFAVDQVKVFEPKVAIA